MPKYMSEKHFSFMSDAKSLHEDTFGVVQFKGVEGISIPFEFEIMLVSDNPEIDFDEILGASAHFTIHRQDGKDVDLKGILADFIQLHEFNGYVFYKAHLVPRMWWLSLSRHNQVCLNKNVKDIIDLTLKDGNLTALDYEFKFQNTYLPKEFVCQYNESNFNFLARWCEREGIYYYFDQDGPIEKIIFTDSHIAHNGCPVSSDIFYSQPSGFVEKNGTEFIASFICHQRQLPGEVFVKDYNYERPSLPIEGRAVVDSSGRGTEYRYGENFPTPEEGKRVASLHAQTHLCRKREYVGESNVPYLRPGYTFNLNGHYRESFNRSYLVETITHEGDQTGYLTSGILQGLHNHKTTVFYRNGFTAIEADVQYRPQRKAMTPRISGTIHAVIDAESSGDYAEIDEKGRYKVRLPFDINDAHLSGKASCFLRMLQPYAGKNFGMHFPLHKGTEVLLTFIDGDPDRPVIAGAVADELHKSPVTSENQTKSVLRDNYGNELVFDSTPGDEHIELYSPHHESGLVLGRSVHSFTKSDSSLFVTGNKCEIGGGAKFECFGGIKNAVNLGLTGSLTIGEIFNIRVARLVELDLVSKMTLTKGMVKEYVDNDYCSLAGDDQILLANDKICLGSGAGPTVNQGRSFVNIYPECISLSTGDKSVYSLKDRITNSGQLLGGIKPQNSVWRDATLASFGIVSQVIISIIQKVYQEKFDMSNNKFAANIVGGSLGLTALFWTINKIIKDKKKNTENKDVIGYEPFEHNQPDCFLSLQRGEGITLGTGLKNPSTQLKTKNDDFASKLVMNANGAISINSNKLAAAQQNAVSKIEIAAGNGNDAKVTLQKIDADDVNVKIESNGSTITITKDGNIEIKAKDKKDVSIKSGENIGFSFQDNTLKLNGKQINFFAPTFGSKYLKWQD